MPDTTPPPPPPNPHSSTVDTEDPDLDQVGHPGGASSPVRNVGSEFVATVLLMLAGPGLIVLGPSQTSPLAIAVAFGGALAIAIGVIGAVANPVLSLALRAVREISARELVEDWIGQIVGGIVGAAVIWGINDLTRSSVGSTGWDAGGFSELGSVIAAELVFTMVLVIVFLSSISQGLSTTAIAAFTGVAYGIGMLVLLGISGGGMNPARSLGSAIFTDTDPNALGQVIVMMIVPLVAAIAAVFIWLAIDEAEVDDTFFDETFIDSLGDAIDGTVD